MDESRPLTATEKAVLDLLLSKEFPGAAELRAQVAVAAVTGRCGCGCPSVDLSVPDDVPRSPYRGRLAPTEARTEPDADGLPLEVILFLDDGALSYLELIHYGEPPEDWPAAASLSVVRAGR
ncbi:hypothetical protein [Saccharothrix violaceirubra]|uniref:Uncharacterized protein n=1 Tax=Saccharothrix violaceirubra TaxID=413306 RepID=A0A7W7T4K4_9PSEU|nr:hypothetical protein [Saccharothrix violaceirubra]MBB4966464.1 hypothetical protein [Saccharothrix violaceirubra]